MAEKLIRDKILDIIVNSGNQAVVRRAKDNDEHLNFLILKLQEEVAEFLENPSVEELADIQEVVKAIDAVKFGYSLESARLKKVENKGAFDRRLIWTIPFGHDFKKKA